MSDQEQRDILLERADPMLTDKTAIGTIVTHRGKQYRIAEYSIENLAFRCVPIGDETDA